jgi:membrane-bound serine protease (ClpP class)
MLELILALTFVGVVLLIAELFLPGMVAGIFGGLFLFFGVALTYTEYGADTGNWLLLAELVLGGAMFFWWMRSFSTSRLGRRYTLQEAVPSDPEQLAYYRFENQEGKALTALRPAGTALIDGHRVDVIAQSELIEAGSPLRVIHVEGTKVVVRRASTA